MYAVEKMQTRWFIGQKHTKNSKLLALPSREGSFFVKAIDKRVVFEVINISMGEFQGLMGELSGFMSEFYNLMSEFSVLMSGFFFAL